MVYFDSVDKTPCPVFEDNHGEYYFFGEGKVYEAFCYFLQSVYKKVWQEIKRYKRELISAK